MIHLTCLSISVTLSFEKTVLFPTIYFREEDLYLGDIILYLGELGPPLGKTGLTRVREVKLSAIFFLGERIYPLDE